MNKLSFFSEITHVLQPAFGLSDLPPNSLQLVSLQIWMCLAVAQQRIIISASLLAVFLLTQPGVWSTLMAAKMPWWFLAVCLPGFPASFLSHPSLCCCVRLSCCCRVLHFFAAFCDAAVNPVFQPVLILVRGSHFYHFSPAPAWCSACAGWGCIHPNK